MISPDKHKKHGKITRAQKGTFASREVALVGTTCDQVLLWVNRFRSMFPQFNIGYADESHQTAIEAFNGTSWHVAGDSVVITTPNSNARYDAAIHLAACDWVIVNGNHFQAQEQIIIYHPDKENSLRKRAPQLTKIKAVILPHGMTQLPDVVSELIADQPRPYIFTETELNSLQTFLAANYLMPYPMKSLILTGGKSTRMGSDKALITHHEQAQFMHLYQMFSAMNISPFISCRKDQHSFYQQQGCNVIADVIEDQGPIGGIVSAFMTDPDCAWLVIACDMPHVDKELIEELIEARDFSKTATCFQSPFDQLPEPLLAIWEPKSYMRMMELFALGYDCPRKTLMNTPVKVITSQASQKLVNVNTPQELQALKG